MPVADHSAFRISPARWRCRRSAPGLVRVRDGGQRVGDMRAGARHFAGGRDDRPERQRGRCDARQRQQVRKVGQHAWQRPGAPRGERQYWRCEDWVAEDWVDEYWGGKYRSVRAGLVSAGAVSAGPINAGLGAPGLECRTVRTGSLTTGTVCSGSVGGSSTLSNGVTERSTICSCFCPLAWHRVDEPTQPPRIVFEYCVSKCRSRDTLFYLRLYDIPPAHGIIGPSRELWAQRLKKPA